LGNSSRGIAGTLGDHTGHLCLISTHSFNLRLVFG
jgi:hypothetical protein